MIRDNKKDYVKIAQKFMQLTWLPRTDDIIILKDQNTNRLLRGRIDTVHKGLCLVSCAPAIFFIPSELHYWPTQYNYIETLRKLGDAIQMVEISKTKIVVSRRYKSLTGKDLLFHFTDRPEKIMTMLLNQRCVDPELNDAFNNIVFAAWHVIRENERGQTEGLPEGPTIRTSRLSDGVDAFGVREPSADRTGPVQ